MEKTVLDVCCGSKMFWFDKNNPNVTYCDQREESHVLCDGRALEINPDIVCDFRALPFDDNSFYHVVFDPPHLVKLGASSWMAKKYGRLNIDWKADLKQGFDECMRVLKPYGTLNFKWNENQVLVSELIKIFGKEPLYGQMRTGKMSTTVWLAYLKDKQP